eukprot:scaffold63400_cov23-Prasinocladus_malaysianus.AAC.3
MKRRNGQICEMSMSITICRYHIRDNKTEIHSSNQADHEMITSQVLISIIDMLTNCHTSANCTRKVMS